MRIAWVQQGTHEEATVSMMGIVSARLVVARDGSWSLMSREGRVTGGKAMSNGHAKQAALVALREALETCANEIVTAHQGA